LKPFTPAGNKPRAENAASNQAKLMEQEYWRIQYAEKLQDIDKLEVEYAK
jgi:hypothetical protein